MGKGVRRTGLLRSNSSYGPPLERSLTVNDDDPSVNARRNSMPQEIIVLARSRSASATVAEIAPRARHRARRRRVSFSRGSASLLPAAQTPDIHADSDSGLGVSHNPPRHNSDPGPTTIKGSWFRAVLGGGKRSDSPRPAPPLPDMIDNAISHIARLMWKEEGETDATAEARVRELLDVDLYRQELRECLQRHEAFQSKFDLDPHVYQIPLVDLYESSSVGIDCGDRTVYVPQYMVSTAEQLCKRAAEIETSDLMFNVVKNSKQPHKHHYHNLISMLDLKTTQIKGFSHRCTTHQIAQVLHHFLRGLHEAPLDPAFFKIIHVLGFQGCRGDKEDSRLSSAEVRAKKGLLTEQEKIAIRIGRILLCIMPQAHADALEYLVMFLNMVSSSTRTISRSTPTSSIACPDTSVAFGYAICGPRDMEQWMCSMGYPPSEIDSQARMDNAEKMVDTMSCQILFWLMCYWFDLRQYREDRKLLESAPVQVPLDSRVKEKKVHRSKSKKHHSPKGDSNGNPNDEDNQIEKKDSVMSKSLAKIRMTLDSRTISSRDRKKAC